MHTSRRNFIKSSAMSFLAMPMLCRHTHEAKISLRFALASDGHFGQPNTNYHAFHEDLVGWMNAERKGKGLDFVILNGDLVHDKPELLDQVKPYYDRLPVPYYVSRGNHDRTTAIHWKNLWGYDFNHVFEKGSCGFVIGDTSNEKGDYRCPDLDWIAQQFKAMSDKKHLFLILHITPSKWTDNGVDCAELRKLIAETPNLAGVFHGHDHDQDGFKRDRNKPYFFDGHIGGNWGTTYRGYRIVEVKDDGSWGSYQFNPENQPVLNSFEAKKK